MADEKKQSDVSVIKGYFGNPPGGGAKEFMAEWKQLTALDKEQLAGGIRDGSLNY